MADSVKHVQM